MFHCLRTSVWPGGNLAEEAEQLDKMVEQLDKMVEQLDKMV